GHDQDHSREATCCAGSRRIGSEHDFTPTRAAASASTGAKIAVASSSEATNDGTIAATTAISPYRSATATTAQVQTATLVKYANTTLRSSSTTPIPTHHTRITASTHASSLDCLSPLEGHGKATRISEAGFLSRLSVPRIRPGAASWGQK